MNCKIMSLFMAIGGLVITSSLSSGAVIYELNYDAVTPSYHQLDFSGPKTLSIESGGIAATDAAKIEFDTSVGSPFSFNYFTNINPTTLNTPTSSSESDYEFSFDVKAEGLAQPSAGGQAFIKLGDARFRANYNATGTYTNISFNLNDMTLIEGSFDLADVTTSAQFQANSLGVSSKFGEDAGNVVRFDNFRLTQVVSIPEPSSLILLSFACIGFVVTRHHRK